MKINYPIEFQENLKQVFPKATRLHAHIAQGNEDAGNDLGTILHDNADNILVMINATHFYEQWKEILDQQLDPYRLDTGYDHLKS